MKSVSIIVISMLFLATIAVAQSGSTVSNRSEPTIVVNVWSSTPPADANANAADPAKLSGDFVVTALGAATRMQWTERRMENSIRMGFPLGEFWIQTDRDVIDDSLRLAALSAKTEADREALRQLENQNERLRLWSDWLIDQNRHLRLANYYISASALDNDERFQDTVTCTQFQLSMLASGRLAEDSSCR
jgi:hypothetical protein